MIRRYRFSAVIIFLLLALGSGSFLFGKERLPDRANADLAGDLFYYPMRGDSLAGQWHPEGNQKIAGSDGFIQVHEDRFFDGKGNPIRFWGVNLYGKAGLPAKENAPHFAQRIANFGFNAVRIFPLYTRVFAKDKRSIDPELLDRLDWFIW